MGLLGIVLLVFFVIICVLLVFMVVIQDSDGDSLGGVFAGSGSSAFGSRASSVVVKVTYALGTLFFVIAFSLALVNRSQLGNVEEAARIKQGATQNNWFEAESNKEIPLPGVEPGLTPPVESPLPSAPATNP